MCSFEWNDKEKRMKEERRRGIGKSNKLLFLCVFRIRKYVLFRVCAHRPFREAKNKKFERLWMRTLSANVGRLESHHRRPFRVGRRIAFHNRVDGTNMRLLIWAPPVNDIFANDIPADGVATRVFSFFSHWRTKRKADWFLRKTLWIIGSREELYVSNELARERGEQDELLVNSSWKYRITTDFNDVTCLFSHPRYVHSVD